ncbi:MAG: ATP-binding cassette domain-containing protein [Rikenellaceae bacterium]|jgi:ABC-2 type transport system ATP-binding protein|nr:ATP-binding cassette domain-containing protein [Rikenellaceae bacterium]
MFTINNLTVGYDSKQVLSELSMCVAPCSIHGIVGYNGAGKTTLLNAIYGLIDVPREAFSFNGEVLKRIQIAYLQAENFFYSNITGRDYLGLFHRRNSRFNPELWREVFDLPLDDLIESYSTGMKKKLALLGVLALDRELIILDEPFNGLDVESVAVLQIVLRRLVAKGKTIIITSHIIESLTTVCDAISLLQEGKICKTYSSAEFAELTQVIHSDIGAKYDKKIERALL